MRIEALISNLCEARKLQKMILFSSSKRKLESEAKMSIADKLKIQIDSDRYHSDDSRKALASECKKIIAQIDKLMKICADDKKAHLDDESASIIRAADASYYRKLQAIFYARLSDYDARERKLAKRRKLEARIAKLDAEDS